MGTDLLIDWHGHQEILSSKALKHMKNAKVSELLILDDKKMRITSIIESQEYKFHLYSLDDKIQGA